MKTRHFLTISSVMYGLLFLQSLFIFQFRLSSANKVMNKHGHFILQGIFPISDGYDPVSKQCFQLNAENIQLTQAMIYTITKFINNSPEILPGIKIGWTLIDSCGSSNVAMPNVVSDLIQSENDRFPQIRCHLANNSDPVTITQSINDSYNQTITLGIIGGRSEKVTIPTAALTSSLAIPQISYYSFDKGLNSRAFYPYFYRTSISFDSHTQYLYNIFNKFNWTWISFVVTDEDWIHLVQSSKSIAYEKYGICYEQIHQLAGNVTQLMLANAVSKLKLESTAQVIVLLGLEDTIYRFLLEAQAQNLTGKTFIGSYTWLSSQRIHQTIDPNIIAGAVGVAFDLESLSGFKAYLLQLDLCNNVQNPWFIDLWNQTLSEINLDFNEIQSNCKLDILWQNRYLQKFYSPDFKIIFVMDAIYAFGRALHIALGCNSTFCPSLHNHKLDMEKFNDILRKVRFDSISKHKVRFADNGNTESVFDMINLQKWQEYGQVSLKAVKIGYWDAKYGLNIDESKILWNNQRQSHPTSKCSEDCPPGFYIDQGNDRKSNALSCCWTCRQCKGSTISNATNSIHCVQCPNFMGPNPKKDRCIDLPEVQQRFGKLMTIIYFVLVSLYSIMLIFLWIVMIIKRKTPIVKGSNFSLINILLFFLALSVPASFLYMIKPSIPICLIRMFVMTTFVTGTYTTILCKINQIIVIFHGAFTSKINLRYLTKNRNQITLIATMVLIVNSILFCLVYAIPVTIRKFRTSNDQIDFLCHVPNSYFDFYLLTWTALLGVLCIYFAFKARSIPDNFNESKHIYLSSIIITVIGICCYPAAYILSGDIADSITGLAAMLLGSSPLLSLFLPKVYIIYFRSEENNRRQILSTITNFTFRKSNRLRHGHKAVASSPTATTSIPTADGPSNNKKFSPDPKNIVHLSDVSES